jgi:transcriptional regulator with XRE-family HTH domain
MAGPTIRRRQLARRMRQLRIEAGKTPAEAADWAETTTSTISKIENAKHAVQLGHIKLLLQLYGIEPPDSDEIMRLAREANQRGWWTSSSYGDTLPKWFRDYVGLENDAEEIWIYDPELIHGLLQTTDYVRAVVSAAQPNSSAADLERSVDLRQARQDKLDSEKPPILNVILGEGALRRIVGGRDVMVKQLDKLIELTSREHIRIRVLPFELGAHPAMVSPFILLRFDAEPDMDVVYLEHDTGALYLERPADIDRYTWIFTDLSTRALDEEGSARRIATVKAQLLGTR